MTALSNSSRRRGVPERERPLYRFGVLTILIVLSFSLNGYGETIESDMAREYVWQDNFDGPAGQLPDAARWDFDIGTDWGNAQLEYDTDRPSNVSHDGNGNLAIVAREEFYMGQPYTSARIVTRDLFEPTYGRVEARIKLPIGQGIWPAFWLLGADIETVGWPQCGEIDIMEYLGHETNTVYGSLHGPGYSGGGAVSQAYMLPSGSFDSDFHVFAVEWEAGVIRWYVDDVLYSTVGPEDLSGNEWVFDHPFYIILNVAVGGNWPGPPDGSTVFPQTMLIDYVKVENAAPAGSCCDIPGDANEDGAANVGDAVYLISYIFGSGSPPICSNEGDANCDGEVNVGDAVYLIAYVFNGGEAPCCLSLPESAIVFSDEFGAAVTFQAFLGSKLDALQIDNTTTYEGPQGLVITVPDAGDPSGSYAGGAFTTFMLRDLSQFNALTFWAKASMAATLDVVGIGNDNTGTSRYVAEATGLALTTTWQEFVIPFPLADKLTAEGGLFYFAEGPENGNGYEIWIDEIVFKNLTTITDPRPVLNTQTINVDPGAIIEPGNGTVTFDISGSDIVISAMSGYFTYTSSNPSVVSVGADGVMTADGAGTTIITALLGPVAATGEITVNVSAPPGEPTKPAPTPTLAPVDVISLYSDVYTNHPVDTWSAVWDMGDVEDFLIGSDSTKKYTNLIFAGIEFASNMVDATEMTHFHIDVWTPDETAFPNVFKVKLVDFGADGAYGGGDGDEHEPTFDENTMSPEIWVSIDVPLATFTNLTTKAHLAQLLISGDPNTVYVDNIYFYK